MTEMVDSNMSSSDAGEAKSYAGPLAILTSLFFYVGCDCLYE